MNCDQNHSTEQCMAFGCIEVPTNHPYDWMEKALYAAVSLCCAVLIGFGLLLIRWAWILRPWA